MQVTTGNIKFPWKHKISTIINFRVAEKADGSRELKHDTHCRPVLEPQSRIYSHESFRGWYGQRDAAGLKVLVTDEVPGRWSWKGVSERERFLWHSSCTVECSTWKSVIGLFHCSSVWNWTNVNKIPTSPKVKSNHLISNKSAQISPKQTRNFSGADRNLQNPFTRWLICVSVPARRLPVLLEVQRYPLGGSFPLGSRPLVAASFHVSHRVAFRPEQTQSIGHRSQTLHRTESGNRSGGPNMQA